MKIDEEVDMPVESDGPSARTRVIQLCTAVARLCDQRRQEQIGSIVAGLDAPVRIAVVGRVSAGKSTLVNALVGRRIAATAAQDTTRVPTQYRFGAPEHAVIIDRDGGRTTVDLARLQEAGSGAEVDRIEVVLQSGVLQSVTILDTPGLAGMETGFRWLPDTVQGRVDAEVLIYLFRGAMRQDDAAVVREFTGVTGGRPPSAVNSVGLLSHADSFGSGGWSADDPIDAAGRSAARVAEALPGCFSAVLPVSGLLAETVRTGRLTENDARALRGLRQVDETTLQFSGQLDTAGDPALAAMPRLSSVLGAYGISRGRAHAQTAESLARWLDDRSGLGAFERHLRTVLLPTIQRGRAEQALDQLLNGARSFSPPAARLIEEAHHGPHLHPIREFRVYRMLLDRCPDSHLVAPLAELVTCGEPADRYRLLGQPDRQRAAAEALRRSSAFTAETSLVGRGVEAEAARTLSISYLQLWQALTPAPVPVLRAGGRR